MSTMRAAVPKCKNSKGQMSLEYMVMSAFLLLIVGLLFTYAYINYDHAMKLDMANYAVDSIAEAADQAYALGTGTVLFVDIILPNGIEGSSVFGKEFQGGNEVQYTLNIMGVQNTIFAKTIAELDSENSVLPYTGISHKMRISMGDCVDGKVTILEVGEECPP
ncbi:MAG: hypothetical protein ABH854_05560 [Candidatus Diapherotrites archaeon]|nr:hypothetical protein [Candidatus Micrarchaeota archaeon]